MGRIFNSPWTVINSCVNGIFIRFQSIEIMGDPLIADHREKKFLDNIYVITYIVVTAIRSRAFMRWEHSDGKT